MRSVTSSSEDLTRIVRVLRWWFVSPFNNINSDVNMDHSISHPQVRARRLDGGLPPA